MDLPSLSHDTTSFWAADIICPFMIKILKYILKKIKQEFHDEYGVFLLSII